ncbi:MAG: hypothetical protein M0P58_08160 [Bacteroidales bacterium]|jgi:hypothetical protein|nr:hypothetical protein [Bacteroidales bacterium]
MEEITQPPLPELKPKRNNLLTLLCILTFIGSGMNLLSSLTIAGFYDTFVEVAQVFSEKFKLPGMETMMEAKPIFFLVSGLFYAGSLVGAYYMFRLKKNGFHIYTIFQILLIIAPMYFMHMAGPSLFDILLSGAFVLLYGTQLKFMT